MDPLCGPWVKDNVYVMFDNFRPSVPMSIFPSRVPSLPSFKLAKNYSLSQNPGSRYLMQLPCGRAWTVGRQPRSQMRKCAGQSTDIFEGMDAGGSVRYYSYNATAP